jgi:hypothetical protein
VKLLQGLLCLMLTVVAARAADEGKPLFNANGDTPYSLFRIHEPVPGELNLNRRIRRDISAYTQALNANPPDNVAEIREYVRIFSDFFSEDHTRGLCEVFLDGIRYSRSGIRTTADASGTKMILKGPNAGLTLLKIFEGYQKHYMGISDFNPTSRENHFAYFNKYLEGLGVFGFSAYLLSRTYKMEESVNQGTAADLRRSWNLAKSVRKLGLSCGALVLALGLGNVWNHLPPFQRLDQEMKPPTAIKPPDLQTEADNAAKEFGGEFEVVPSEANLR